MLVDRPAAVIGGYAAHRLGRELRRLQQRGAFDGMHAETQTEIAEAIAELETAGQAWLATRNGNRNTPSAPPGAASGEQVSVQEAAQMLGVTARRVRQLAPLLGVKVGGRWRLTRDAVLDHCSKDVA